MSKIKAFSVSVLVIGVALATSCDRLGKTQTQKARVNAAAAEAWKTSDELLKIRGVLDETGSFWR